MKELSEGLLVAWQIAAIETGLSNHQFIEKDQILIGICSLGKVSVNRKLNLNYNNKEIQEIKQEFESFEKLLSTFKLDTTNLRRKLREECGKGNYKHTEKIIHRSEDCKDYFKQADFLTNNALKVKCLHFFAALMKNPEGIIYRIMNEKKVDLIKIQKKAVLLANLNQNHVDLDSYII